MPSGRTHDILTLGGAVVGSGVLLRAGLAPTDVASLAAIFVWSGCMLSCDLDLKESRPYQRWSPIKLRAVFQVLIWIVEALWSRSLKHPLRALKMPACGIGLSWMWAPYAAAIAHRSPLSHWPILGSALRIFYLSAMLTAICWAWLAGPVAYYRRGDLELVQALAIVLDLWDLAYKDLSAQQIASGLIAIELASLVHIGPDHLVTWWRNRDARAKGQKTTRFADVAHVR